MYYILNIPEGVSVKTFINNKINEGYTFYSLYAESHQETTECKNFTLPLQTTINDFIDYLENNYWEIIRVTFLY